MSLKTINSELSALEAQHSELSAQEVLHADNGAFNLVAELKAQIEHIGKRISSLIVDKEAAQAKAALDAKFASYEVMLQEAFAHYTRITEIDTELKALNESIDKLNRERYASHTLFKQAPTSKRQKLSYELRGIDKKRVETIAKKYKVGVWM